MLNNYSKKELKKYKYLDLITLRCEVCKNTYTRNKRSLIRSLNKGICKSYCSSACRNLDKKLIMEYVCKYCFINFKDLTSNNRKFCSSSCSAKFNNTKNKSKKQASLDEVCTEKENITFCKNCNNKLSGKKIYCTVQCYHQKMMKDRINSGKFSAQTGKKWLIFNYGKICFVCKRKTWMDKEIPIELDHIDGNYKNNSLENLRLICPNCHAQTKTYKGRNKGSGRHYRKTRYKNGKSY